MTTMPLLSRIEAFETLNRDWRAHLTVTERDVLFYLIDNTVSWGRDRVRATVDQMVRGTDWGLPPIGLARRTVFKIIAALREKGVLVVRATGRKVSEFIVNLEWNPMALPVPKRKRIAEGSEVHDMHGTPEPEVHIVHPKIVSTPSGEDGKSAAREPSALERIRKIREKSRAKKAQSTEVDDVWAEAWREAYPGEKSPGLSGRDRGQLKQVVKRFPNGIAVIRWAVANWPGVMGRQFHWMTDPPSRPAPGFILRFVVEMANDLAASEDKTAYWKSTQEEQVYKAAIASGKTHDEALLEVGRSRAITDGRRELAKGQDALRQRAKELQIEREGLDRMRRASTAAPAKPREKPTINHGTNPWDNGGGEVPDFSDLPEWDGDE